MAPHSIILAWKIPRTGEPDRLQSTGSLRVRHSWGTSLSLFTFIHWRRKWQPTSVFFPGESQGRGSLVGCRLWGRTESDDWSDLAAAVAAYNTKKHNSNMASKSYSPWCIWSPCPHLGIRKDLWIQRDSIPVIRLWINNFELSKCGNQVTF